jgi:hypothetical protein
MKFAGEEEGTEESICRICYSEATSENALISPCDCAGSMKYIHTQCLHAWRQYPDQYLRCPVCATIYFRNVKFEDISFEQNTIDKELTIYLIFGGFSLNVVTIGIPKQEREFTGELNLVSLCMVGHILYFMYYMIGYISLLRKVNNRFLYLKQAAECVFLPIIHIAALYCLKKDPVIFIMPLAIITQTYYKYHEQILNKINAHLNGQGQ